MQDSLTAEQKGIDASPLELIKRAERSRTTVRRVREYLEGDRCISEVQKGDWFATLEYVREETGVELALFSEYDTVRLQALDDSGLWVLQATYNDVTGYSTNKRPRWDVEEGFAFRQSGDHGPEIVRLETAKQRFREAVDR
ncbi:hypothetical protein ACLI4U_18925 (plasmid) [Natrialbaceae archaeon A-CW2]